MAMRQVSWMAAMAAEARDFRASLPSSSDWSLFEGHKTIRFLINLRIKKDDISLRGISVI